MRETPGSTGSTAPRSGSGSVRKGMDGLARCWQGTCSKLPRLATEQRIVPGSARDRTGEETAMAKGLLFASFDYSGAHEDEFHDWYDLEHIPERLRVPGFINAERWIGDENPKIAIATYDLDNPRVLYTPPYE